MHKTTNLSSTHFLLALITVIIWGLNFVAIYVGLQGFPPLLLCSVRFGLAAFPWIFFLSKPKAPLKLIAGYGLFTFVMQFGLMFSGIYLGLSAGLSSLVLQVQVFFSMGLAAFFFQDRPSIWKIFGSLISFTGIGIVALNIESDTTIVGLVLALLAAFCWAAGNMFSKKVDAESPLALVVWGNFIAFPFMVILSLLIEGPVLITESLNNISIETILAVIYITYLSTHVGYGAWGFLLNAYPTATVVPFTLMVPVVGFLGSAIFLNESLPSWKLTASLLVMCGLMFNLLERQIQALFARIRSRA